MWSSLTQDEINFYENIFLSGLFCGQKANFISFVTIGSKEI
jgi:hypothetical protein